MSARTTFPFSAIFGRDEMKPALLTMAVDAGIGGVLAFGNRVVGRLGVLRGMRGWPVAAFTRDCAGDGDA